MDLKEHLENIIRNSDIIDKVSVIQKVDVLWFLKKEIEEEVSNKYLNDLQKYIDNNIKDVKINFKIVKEAELAMDEIPYIK